MKKSRGTDSQIVFVVFGLQQRPRLVLPRGKGVELGGHFKLLLSTKFLLDPVPDACGDENKGSRCPDSEDLGWVAGGMDHDLLVELEGQCKRVVAHGGPTG